eukprot:15481397-Alexandrium_andersonii.AAC.1
MVSSGSLGACDLQPYLSPTSLHVNLASGARQRRLLSGSRRARAPRSRLCEGTGGGGRQPPRIRNPAEIDRDSGPGP